MNDSLQEEAGSDHILGGGGVVDPAVVVKQAVKTTKRRMIFG